MAYTQPDLNEALIPSTEGKYHNYQKMSSTILGTCHIIVVIVLIVINSAGMAMRDTELYGVTAIMGWNLAWCLLVSSGWWVIVDIYIYIYIYLYILIYTYIYLYLRNFEV